MKRFASILVGTIFIIAQTIGAHAAIVATGNVDPDDPSTWANDIDAYIGYIPEDDVNNGTGSVSVTDGDDIVSYRGCLGYDANSSGTVTISGEGSTWANGNVLYVGQTGSGSLNITNGGAASISCGYIAYLSDSLGEVNVDGAGSVWNNSHHLYIGKHGSGSLNITNGSTVSIGGVTYVTYDTDTIGTINFGESGGGTLTTQTLYFALPSQLTGTGTINTNGLVCDLDLTFDTPDGLTQTLVLNSQENQNIVLNLDMSDLSKIGDFGVGYRGNASLSISNGVNIYSDFGYVGYFSGSSGTATISGTGSTWTNSDELYVGLYGSGTLNITSGGAVSNTIGLIGNWSNSSGEVTVDGESSNWTNSGNLFVGQFGSGTLNITNCGSVSNVNGYLGSACDSSGSVTVDGTGSTWTSSGEIFVGLYGSGTINITNGGAVSNANGCIGDDYDSSGIVTVNGAGSTWTNSEELLVGLYGNATLNITDGGAVSNTNGYLGYYDHCDSSSTINVDGKDSTWTNSGNLFVGHESSGTLNISDGGLVSVAGTLTVDSNENGDGFINISDGGMLAISGEADDSLTAFFDLVEGTDAIQWWDPEASGWNLLDTATLDEDYTLEYLTDGDLTGYTLLTVTAIEPTTGDANCDGRVDGSDVTILANNWQVGVDDAQTATWAMGDFNGDGSVDGSDVTILANNWQYGVTSSAATVPEPASVVSLLMLFVAGLVCVTKKRW